MPVSGVTPYLSIIPNATPITIAIIVTTMKSLPWGNLIELSSFFSVSLVSSGFSWLFSILWSQSVILEPRYKKTVFFFAYAKTKTQISCAVTAQMISAFVFATRIVQSLYFLNPIFQASSHLMLLYSPVCVGPGRKPRRPVFSQRGSFRCHMNLLARGNLSLFDQV